MAVLKILVSAALLATIAKCQDIYTPYSSGGASSAASIGQYSPSILSRGTPRLVPLKVRPSASRFFPSYFYPGIPPPPLSPYHHQHSPSSLSPMHTHSPTYPSQRVTPTFPQTQQQYRTAMTGYYRPTRQSSSSAPTMTSSTSYYNHPYHHESGQHQVYHTAATSSPAVLKRGRVLSAPSPYSLESTSVSASSSAALSGVQYSPQQSLFPQYRQAVHQPQPQISASPVHHHQPQQLLHQVQAQPQIQHQQPSYYIQKSPVVVGPGRPVKVAKANKRPLPLPTSDVDTADAEEEYPGDPNPQYNFSFDIKDDELTNYQNRQEERDGQTIKGSYSVVDPDGYVRTVTYTADPKNGFQAKVTREPTDVKIKFPVPTEAPAAAEQPTYVSSGKHSGGVPRQRQSYLTPQYHPQYQQTAYATPQQVFAPQVHVQQQQPQYVPRVASRFAVQPQTSATSPRARIVRRARRPAESKPTTAEQTEQKQN